jgi:hypothetical protein
MTGGFPVDDRRSLAAWVILVGVLLAVVVVAIVDNKGKQRQ